MAPSYRNSAQTAVTVEGNAVSSLLVRNSTGTLGAFPVINGGGAVAAYNLASGFQIIQRFDFNGSTFTSQAIARAEASQAAPNAFSFVSPIVGLANDNTVYFYAERTEASVFRKSIYGSKVELSNPGTPIASTAANYSDIEPFAAASGAGPSTVNPLFRGTTGGTSGAFVGTPTFSSIGTAGGYTTTGIRPSVTSSGVTASYGIYKGVLPTPVEGVFLDHPQGGPWRAGNLTGGTAIAPRLTAVGAQPATIVANSRIASNDFGQVTYLGADLLGQTTLFTTSLGRSRRLVGVGDQFSVNGATKTITGLQIFDGLKKNGQTVFWASVAGNEEFILRAGRAFTQAKLINDPITPSYRTKDYLLRSVQGSGFPPSSDKTINAAGCNLVSTTNILTAYGVRDTPGDFHDWLVDNWQVPPAGMDPEKYINSSPGVNDFTEGAVRLRSSELQAGNFNSPVIRFAGIHNSQAAGALTNLAKIISEVRQGYPVKLHVPNGKTTAPSYKSRGHFVIAYGLKDPAKADAAVQKADVLIHDPGHGGVFTLGDYGAIVPKNSTVSYDQYASNWLEADNRVIMYRPVVTPILPPDLFITITGAPLAARAEKLLLDAGAGEGPGVEAVLTDATGKRLGADPAAGNYAEIAGQYYRDPTYYGLDGEPGEGVPAWGVEAVQRLWVDGMQEGEYSLELIGTTGGAYSISVASDGRTKISPSRIEGMLNPGERRTVTVTIEIPRERSDLQLRIEALGATQVQLKIASATGSNYLLQSSTNLKNWSDVGEAKAGTGADLEWQVSSQTKPGTYFRALITTP